MMMDDKSMMNIPWCPGVLSHYSCLSDLIIFYHLPTETVTWLCTSLSLSICYTKPSLVATHIVTQNGLILQKVSASHATMAFVLLRYGSFNYLLKLLDRSYSWYGFPDSTIIWGRPGNLLELQWCLIHIKFRILCWPPFCAHRDWIPAAYGYSSSSQQSYTQLQNLIHWFS